MTPFNLILTADTLKHSHRYQYPPQTQNAYYYYSARKAYAALDLNETLFFGLMPLLQKIAGSVIWQEHIDEAEEILHQHFGAEDVFYYAGWRRILKKYQGRLPIRIKAVPEGTVVPVGNILMTVEATDAEFYWLPGFLETYFQHLWFPITVATVSAAFKKLLKPYVLETGSVDTLDGKLNDFSPRSASSDESQILAGISHLAVFDATSNVAAIRAARGVYRCEIPLKGICAMEHGTVGSWGPEGEVEAYRNMLRRSPDHKIISCVSDTYDIDYAICEIWGKQLLDEARARQNYTAIRLDSGDPVTSVMTALTQLEGIIGTTTNAKGYKVLNHPYRLVQGDGVSLQMLGRILEAMKRDHYSTDNIFFGTGRNLIAHDRDCFGFAYKLSEVTVGSVARDVYKAPKGDPTKASLRGRQKLVRNPSNRFETVREDHRGYRNLPDRLVEVFCDGSMYNVQDMESIRERSTLW